MQGSLGPPWVAFHQAGPTQTLFPPGLAIAKENLRQPEVSVQLVFIIKAKIVKRLSPHPTMALPPTSRFIPLCPVKVKTRSVWKRLRDAHAEGENEDERNRLRWRSQMVVSV